MKRTLRIPVIANGSVQCKRHAIECLRFTHADAIMSATGLLRAPSLFLSCLPPQKPSTCECTAVAIRADNVLHDASMAIQNCRRYLSLVRAYWDVPGALAVNGCDRVKVVRDHLFAILQYFIMDVHMDLWSMLGSKSVTIVDQFDAIVSVVSSRLLCRVCCGKFSESDSSSQIVFSLRDIKCLNQQTSSLA